MDPNFYAVWVSADFFRPMMLRVMLADLEFCKFRGKDPESDDLMKRIELMGGNMVWGKVAREDSQGICLSRELGKSKVTVMIFWKFVHAVLGGSAKQMNKFGFDDKERVPAEVKG